MSAFKNKIMKITFKLLALGTILLSSLNGFTQDLKKTEVDTVHLSKIIINHAEFRKQLMQVDFCKAVIHKR